MDKINKDFQSLINKEKYQVFIFYCPAYFPFNFARHPWFVLNDKETISRYEIRHYKNGMNNYLFKNRQSPFEGINMSFFSKRKYLNVRLLGYLEGDENSTAQKVVEFIKNSEKTYLYCKKYFFRGPNSNTYVQNVLNNFPEFNIKLSWRFIGKGFKIKE